jgi:hypothetical protein
LIYLLMKQNKIYIIILFSTAFLSTLCMAVSFWNRLIHEKYTYGFWPVFFLILSLVLTGYLLVRYLRDTDESKTEALIGEKVIAERKKILGEFEKKDEIMEVTDTQSDQTAEDIIPSGNFKSEENFANKLLVNLSKSFQAGMGIYYTYDNRAKIYKFLTGFALAEDAKPSGFRPGQDLNGQVALTKEVNIIKDIPEDYFNIESGTGKGKPGNIIIIPVVNNNTTIAVIEIANFISIDEKSEKVLKDVGVLAAKKLDQITKS